MTAETADKSAITVADVLKSLIDKNPEGGEIKIDALEKQVPNMTRTEIIRDLRRNNSLGVFVTGRRGKPSRFVYGAPAVALLHREQPNRNQRRTDSSDSASDPDGSSISHGIELRVNVGGQVTTIPIKLELAGVAA